jgi:hypothetical protein
LPSQLRLRSPRRHRIDRANRPPPNKITALAHEQLAAAATASSRLRQERPLGSRRSLACTS